MTGTHPRPRTVCAADPDSFSLAAGDLAGEGRLLSGSRGPVFHAGST